MLIDGIYTLIHELGCNHTANGKTIIVADYHFSERHGGKTTLQSCFCKFQGQCEASGSCSLLASVKAEIDPPNIDIIGS